MGISYRSLLPGRARRRLTCALIRAALALLAASFAWLPAGRAQEARPEAGVKEITNFRYPAFDPKTGKRIWTVTTEKAWPVEADFYRAQNPHVIVYGNEHTIEISSRSGSVRHRGRADVTFTLEDQVVIRVDDPSRTVVTTEKLEWVASASTLRSDARVKIARTDFTVSGDGLELKPKQGTKEPQFIRLLSNVAVEIAPAAARSPIFADLAGRSAEKDDAEGPPMFVGSSGPMTIDRDTNIISLSDNVQARRENFRIRCDNLRLAFDPETRRLKDINGEGNVQAFDGENGVSGDTLSWDALSSLIEVTGNPAKTWRGSATVSAQIIWFSQTDGKVLWSGRAQIFAPPMDSGDFFRFGGDRN